MSTVDKISIALTKGIASLVREAVDDGEYASTSEVIRDALRDWKLKRIAEDEQITEVRRLWQAGIESGSVGALEIESIKREAREAARKSAR